MLDCTPENLTREAQASLELRQPTLRQLKESVRAYAISKRAGSADAHVTYQPENPYYEYLSLVVPSVAFNNPRVRVKTHRAAQRPIAMAMQEGENRWAHVSCYSDHSALMAYDMAFAHGASVVKNGEYKNGGKWPTVHRVSPHLFIIDPLADDWTKARWIGHGKVWDKADLLKLAEDPKSGWDATALAALAEDSGLERTGRPDEARNKVPTRKEVVCWEMWVRDYAGEDGHYPGDPEKPWPKSNRGFNGAVFTIVLEQSQNETAKAMWVRKPKPYFGPKRGPYTVYGAYQEPESAEPLSPLQAVKNQIDDVNAHETSIDQGCAHYKRLIVTSSSKLAAQVKSKPHDTIFVDTGFVKERDLQEAETGGVTEQMLVQVQRKKARLDRMLAMDDAQRGVVSGDSTATENTIASEATAKRTAHLKRQHTKAATNEFYIVGYFLYHDERVEIPLGEDTAKARGAAQSVFQGGRRDQTGKVIDTPEQPGEPSYEDLELEIEPYSMEYTSEAMIQTRTLQSLQLFTGVILPSMMQYPFADWKSIMAQVGDALNNPSMADWADPDQAAKMGEQMRQMEAQAQAPTNPTAGPAPQGGRVGPAAVPSMPRANQSKPAGPSQRTPARNTGVKQMAGAGR